MDLPLLSPYVKAVLAISHLRGGEGDRLGRFFVSSIILLKLRFSYFCQVAKFLAVYFSASENLLSKEGNTAILPFFALPLFLGGNEVLLTPFTKLFPFFTSTFPPLPSHLYLPSKCQDNTPDLGREKEQKKLDLVSQTFLGRNRGGDAVTSNIKGQFVLLLLPPQLKANAFPESFSHSSPR